MRVKFYLYFNVKNMLKCNTKGIIMEEKKLQNYLLKAEYLRVVIQGDKKSPAPPLRHVNKRKNSTKYILNRLSRAPYRKQNADRLADLMKRSTVIELSLKVSDLEANANEWKSAKVANAIEKGQNLHLLYYKMVYFASQKKPTIKWKRPYRYNAALRLRNMNNNSASKSFLAKFSKIDSNSSELLKEGKKILDQNALAMEHEFSDRRNYRNSTPLHT